MADSWLYQPTASAAGTDQESPKAATTNLSAFRDAVSTSPPETARQGPGISRIRRRNRIITSCLECRRRKLKCDKLAPCTNCTRFKRDCLYLAPSLDSQSQLKLAEMKERMGALEKGLEREVASQTVRPHLGGSSVAASESTETHPVEGDDDLPSEEDEVALEPSPLAALDAGYEDNADDEMMDLGVQMGKMRITDRIGGWVRPKLMDELNDTLEDVRTGKSRWGRSPLQVDHRDVPSLEPPSGSRIKLQASPKSYIGPGPDYIAPASSLFFPGTNSTTSLLEYLPSIVAADALMAQYWYAVHPVAKIAHRPSLEAQYALFWESIRAGMEPLPSLQAVIFATMFSSAVSLTNERVLSQFGTSKTALIDSLRSGTEMALSKANFLRTTKIDTMQAFVSYLIPLVRAEVSRAHSALVGTAIRLGECMGLHRDGSHYNMTPIEVHIRRLIWHQLCFLDQRTCEATGPRPQIRIDDYDTKFPLNVNDDDLINASEPLKDKTHWTDNTLFRIRTECVEMRRQVWFDIIALDRKKKSLTSILVRVQKFRNMLESTYYPMLNDEIPVHTFAKHVMALGVNGMIITILHRYLFSTTTRMPDRLRQVLIQSGLSQMENAIAMETDHNLTAWVWYKGAFNQYHSALLLMVEVYAYPMRKDAAKIWRCLDYIFDIPSHLSPKQKAELVITDLRDRLEIYSQMRRIRSTTQLEARITSMGNKSGLREIPEESAQPKPLQHLPVPKAQPLSIPRAQPAQTQSRQQQQSFNDIYSQAQAPVPVVPTAQFTFPMASPPPPATLDRTPTSDSQGPSSRQGSINNGAGGLGEISMEDIDWNEWDKYFPVETNTGQLDLEDFDISNFTGADWNTGPGASSTNIPGAYSAVGNHVGADMLNNGLGGAVGDMSDVGMGSEAYTFIPAPKYMAGPSYGSR
ncbi:hypothetical protein B0A48_15257 [Cryoendolithus antarcticus]|uniref:Zn(2)-C6 fungal-type domain-containing protein n=1 Tax=Cryoendolithus antarcticus TaxID=1507870 RepID=A0A1V8SJ54_9PEZI|nr:hypothetical protein B0A48_15257 [Cryoendolithus antarcticus]